MNLRDFVDVKSRRMALENALNLKLDHVGDFVLDAGQASVKNCENMIGAVQIPLGVAGPLKLKIQNEKLKKDFFVPLATTEGALVASVNRGCSAIFKAGGVSVFVDKAGMSRAPVFAVENVAKGRELILWTERNFDKIKEAAESTSGHLRLLRIEPYQMGRNVWLRFVFDTEEAMGMNMATIAVARAVQFIEDKIQARCIALSGNMCVDKKPNFLNFTHGRGYKVLGDIVIPDEIVSTVLKTTTEKIIEVSQRKLLYGSAMSGMIGANAQFANILAAIFIATGQDPAHVAECSMGVSTFEKVDGGLYVSVYLPDMVVGTVGGGTGLATQKEALSIMGIGGEKRSGQELAGIIAGAVLAGEISLLASLAENTLARAHEKYGRGK